MTAENVNSLFNASKEIRKIICTPFVFTWTIVSGFFGAYLTNLLKIFVTFLFVLEMYHNYAILFKNEAQSTHCYIEQVGQFETGVVHHVLKGYRKHASDITISKSKNFSELVDYAKQINCPIKLHSTFENEREGVCPFAFINL